MFGGHGGHRCDTFDRLRQDHLALGDRFGLFIQTLNNDKKTIQFDIQFKNKIKLFIRRIYSFKN